MSAWSGEDGHSGPVARPGTGLRTTEEAVASPLRLLLQSVQAGWWGVIRLHGERLQ